MFVHKKANASDGFACALHDGCCFGRYRSKPSVVCPEWKWALA